MLRKITSITIFVISSKKCLIYVWASTMEEKTQKLGQSPLIQLHIFFNQGMHKKYFFYFSENALFN